MVDKRFANIDWERMLTRLVGLALRWFIQERCFDEDAILPGTGQSSKDLAYGAVIEVLRDERIQWKPRGNNDDPFPLFATVMRHNFLDLVKEGREHRRIAILDAGDTKKQNLEDLPDPRDQFSEAEAAALACRLYPYLEGDTKLKEHVDAVLLLGLEKRDDIAGLLDTTGEDISNRRRRLQLALAKWRRSVTQ